MEIAVKNGINIGRHNMIMLNVIHFSKLQRYINNFHVVSHHLVIKTAKNTDF